tara:strand:+ start:186 stop:767 length:582 start_codon:yes stop_codon:yes gene_type:complete
MIRLGVLGSSRGTDLQAIIESIKNKSLNAEISIVISNIKNAFILERARTNNIKNKYISHKNKTREEFDAEISTLLVKNKIDLILLIGFMRILSSNFCIFWTEKLLNVHPSLLPLYAGGMDVNVHEEVLKNKDKVTGCTIHFVTEDLDRGPIILQKKCDVDETETVKSLKNKVQKLEGEAFIEAIKLIGNNNAN